ncbi:MAG: 16S rRNA processing protein RimM [Oscillospiraceae bacterium]|nr:16S rRNA processing protein RimM [Oscillospiraceae bacterium]
MEKYLEAGRITNTHGIKGEVKIEVWVDSPEFLRKFKVLYIDNKPVKLLAGRTHKGFLLAKLEGFDDVNAAMTLKNKLVFIDRKDAKLPKGSYFLADLMGARVVDEQGNELGELADIMELPAGNVYVVRGEREILIPAVPEFIKKTDISAGLVTVRLIDGM